MEVEIAGRARQLLESPTLSDKAWGARLAAGLRLAGFDDLLIAELRACQRFRDAATDGPEYAYIQSLFDSLIEREAQVPVDVIHPFRSRWRTEALILLSRGRENTSTLLDMQIEAMDDIKWLAISNMLLQRRSGKLFERMLDGLPITHSFSVMDRVGRVGIGGWHGDGIAPHYPRRTFPIGFPAISLYRLAFEGGAGSLLVADGPRKVFFHRIVIPIRGSVEWPDEIRPPTTTLRVEYRLEYLALLGNLPLEKVRQMFQSRTEIQWRDNPALLREMALKLDEQAFDLRNFVIGSKLRGASDADFVRLEIKPTLTDFRRHRDGLLAQPKSREIVLDLR